MVLDILAVVLAALALVVGVVVLLRLSKLGAADKLQVDFDRLQHNVQLAIEASDSAQARLLQAMTQAHGDRLDDVNRTLSNRLREFSEQAHNANVEGAQRLETIRTAVEQRLTAIQTDNALKLEQMRATVDEKLQATLETRIAQSFKSVSEQLEQVYKGLGEMQSLATGVGDLKKLLSGSKTRGILGEQQLSAILEQIMAPDQYQENVATTGTTERVEFAIKLPGDDESPVWLPIDAKFPIDPYNRLLDAYENGTETTAAANELKSMIKQAAKSIRDKYLQPPATTDFGIMFLPTEGLYAEVLRLDITAELQSVYKVIVAGPTTMAALLNSLQMGFRTLAIQKRSSEVWQVLNNVKTEFGKFNDVLMKAQDRLRMTSESLESLVGTRSRAIERSLRNIEKLPDEQTSLDFLALEDGKA